MRLIDKIIIHCSATPEGREHTVADIDRWHKNNGWNEIGYHYVIYLDGSIHKGRDVEKVGAHCTGHNKNSIGICYIGGCDKDMKPKDTRTDAQKNSIIELLTRLKKWYPEAKIYGHRDFANKACPGFDATKEYAEI
jgi:N-acetylmuramoyl-L-alanine amidase